MSEDQGTTRDEFCLLMAKLDLGTRGKGPSPRTDEQRRRNEPAQIDVWYESMRDLPPMAIRMAVERFLCEATGKEIWPEIGVLRRYATESMHGVPLTADAAWEAVRTALRRWSIYHTPEENERILATVPEPARTVARRIGWATLSNATDLGPLMRPFLYHYGTAVERFQRMRALPSRLRPRIDAPEPLPKTLPSPEVKRLASQLGNLSRKERA